MYHKRYKIVKYINNQNDEKKDNFNKNSIFKTLNKDKEKQNGGQVKIYNGFIDSDYSELQFK